MEKEVAEVKKYVFVFLIIGLLLTLPLMGNAEIVDSGTCGENLTWTLDDEGLLSINGTGEMWDYHEPWFLPPWTNLPVKIMVINEGVTSIGHSALCFSEPQSIEFIFVPNSVLYYDRSNVGQLLGKFRCNWDSYFADNLGKSGETYQLPNTAEYVFMNEFNAICLVGIKDKTIETLEVPSFVTQLGGIDYPGFGCGNLSELILNSNVKLQTNPLRGGDDPVTVILNENVSFFDIDGFGRVSNLNNIFVSNENSFFSSYRYSWENHYYWE